ncbi:MAG: hypothetical protein HUJ94_05065 [Bacteroidales bacterium]|nr:hypothetical protein [Bacteroidales bacterium]
MLYYSQTGATKAVAECLAAKVGADIEEIEITAPYDGNFEETISRVIKEREGGILPELRPLNVRIEDYDVIYLGYPVWFGTYAPPVAALLETQNFDGRKIVPFCTFGSGGIESSSVDMASKLPGTEILQGYGVRNARIAAAPSELDYFLKANGYVEGTVETLPEFSEQHPVTEVEVAVFEAACGNYQMPLGTAVSTGSRTLADGTVEYNFTVNTSSPTGEAVKGTIYVTCAQGRDPEFTRVVR